MGSKIREKFVEHMELFGLAKQTQRGYISGIRCLANHYNQSPETLTDDERFKKKYYQLCLCKGSYTSVMNTAKLSDYLIALPF